MDSPVPSPCINICVIDECTGFCAGCFRTLDEIAGWGGISNQTRREILAHVVIRRRAAVDAVAQSAGEQNAREQP